MNIWDIILDYLKVMLNSWPLIILIIFLTYRKQISNLLARIYKGRLYGVTFEATPIVQKNKINQDKIYNSPIDKAIEYFRKKPKEALNFYINLYKAFVFEKAFNVIFGTQIRLLEYLEKKEGNAEKKGQLNIFYTEYLNRTNPLNKRSTQQQYFAFLYAYKFIGDFRTEEQVYTKILDLGKDFLIYLRSQYPLLYINKPY